jgi:four helix bundle protein
MTESIIQKKSFAFALKVISLYRELQSQHEYVLSSQLLRSGTSIDANVEEASTGQSRRDFMAKMSIASKEARETRYWLRLLQQSKLVDVDVATLLIDIDEIIRILTSIVKTTSKTSSASKLKTQNLKLKT